MDNFFARISRTDAPGVMIFWPVYFIWVFFVVSSIAVSNTIIIVLSPLQFFSKRAYRHLCEFFAWLLWPFFVYSLEVVGRNRVHFYGFEDIPKKETAIVLSNHVSYMDWLMTFVLACRKQRVHCVKVQVKQVIKYIPFVGLAIQGVGFIFLNRNWTEDRSSLKHAFNNLKTLGMPFWLLSHPEGSRWNKEKLEESNQFAKKRDLPQLKHVLLPRVKGFITTATMLRNQIDAVYDISIAYSQQPPNFWVLFSGSRPIEIHLFVRRFPIASIPKDEPSIADWLYKVYAEKDQLIEEFKKNGKYTSGRVIGTPYCDDNIGMKFLTWTFVGLIPFYAGLWYFVSSKLLL